jgi:hypothetical protein
MSQSVAASRGLTSPGDFSVPAPSLRATLADFWRTVTTDLTRTYRPERHYMRGPGPKWHAKHDHPGLPTTA